jgi:hypothetical protein
MAPSIKEGKMDYFAGLDVSLETINVCIVNAAGDVLFEKKTAAEPAAIVHLLKSFGSPFKRIGLEAGPTSSWLYSELRAAGYGAICLGRASMRPSAFQDRAMLERISASPRNAIVLVRLTMTAASVVAVTRWSAQPCIRQRTFCCIMADGHRSDPGPCGSPREAA